MCPNAAEGSDSPPQVYAPPYPFANMMIYQLISWMNSGSSQVSESKVVSLVKDIMLAKDFDPEHLQGFSAKGDSPRPYTIPRFHYCPLVDVIRGAFRDAQAAAFHLMPFKHLWKSPLDGHKERIYDELYTSDV
ncbi:uncharacterized protein BJ212DRAFT_1306427 [Suillus subaureus]|uniref:Uncharacterized protein n=1 Tax=Suillus subaureus TaxID=48587 RepID=A0A9P7AT70_9AGAM|nr:uncharacterized protein BJ212DRAFT_1306427 [Suillus subaureus]KAG1796104.1 hypothetical protein BJ212DRAFT_1306427 [Suillus subaureus]